MNNSIETAQLEQAKLDYDFDNSRYDSFIIDIKKLISDIAKQINEFSNPNVLQNLLIDFQDKNADMLEISEEQKRAIEQHKKLNEVSKCKQTDKKKKPRA